MTLSAVYRLFASALLACVASSIALSSQAHATEQSPLAPNCWPEVSSSFEILEYWLSPADHTIVTAGTPVAFSGRSEAPLIFAVASQRSLISTPDIDSGPGVASNPEPAPQTSYTYTFTSAVAANLPETVYWQASFSTADIDSCSGLTPSILRTGVRALTIVPAPVKAGIEAVVGVGGTQPTISYGAHCTASCVGDTYYQMLVLARHKGARHIPSLDLGPTPVSIAASSGGSELFSHRYTGSAVRTLEHLIDAGDDIEIEINVKATDQFGNVSRAHETDPLHLAGSRVKRAPSH